MKKNKKNRGRIKKTTIEFLGCPDGSTEQSTGPKSSPASGPLPHVLPFSFSRFLSPSKLSCQIKAQKGRPTFQPKASVFEELGMKLNNQQSYELYLLMRGLYIFQIRCRWTCTVEDPVWLFFRHSQMPAHIEAHAAKAMVAFFVLSRRKALCPRSGAGLRVNRGGTMFLLILSKAKFIGYHL